MTEDLEKIAEYIKKIHFRKTIFGGIDEDDVWRQLEALQEEYERILLNEKAGAAAVLKERDAEISHLKKLLASGKDTRSDLQE